MAEKDIAEKILVSYADVFPDCMNALAYEGKRRSPVVRTDGELLPLLSALVS